MKIRVKRKITKSDITRTLLASVQASGLLAVALVAPNVIKSLAKIGIVDFKNRGSIGNARRRLVKKGYLEIDKNNFLRLTKAGEGQLKKLQLLDYELIIPRTWDGKWRVLIFDIPEYQKGLRDKVRNTLRLIGFERIQDSVWVFPYDCAELVSLLKADFKIGKDLLYLIVEEIENDLNIRKKFNLN